MNKRTNIVCLDSDILIWGLKKEATDGQEHMIIKAEAFISYLYKLKKRIIIPAPILTELTWILDKEKRDLVVDIMSKRFIIAPFDKKAALICSDLLSQFKSYKEYENIKNELGKRRLKFDTMIIAIAISNECEQFYTNNVDDYKLASKHIVISQIPFIPQQTEFPFKNE